MPETIVTGSLSAADDGPGRRPGAGRRAGLAGCSQRPRTRGDCAAEVAGGDGASAVCAWNHFENIPTFYNWNNRPR